MNSLPAPVATHSVVRRTAIIAALLIVAAGVGTAAAQDRPAQTVELWSPFPITVQIEWMTVVDGRATITARRMEAMERPVALTVTPGAGRFVRFSYPGASPRTLAASDVIAARRLRVPDVLPGGELLLVVPHARVRPVSLAVSGPRVAMLPVGPGEEVDFAGVPAGTYHVAPVYDGGIAGAARTFVVTSTATTVGAMPVEAVGAARIAAERAVCGNAAEVSIAAMTSAGPAGAQTPLAPARLVSKDARCEMQVDGLPAGRYQVAYRSAIAGTGTAVFDVAAQGVSAVRVARPAITVSGQVRVNGRPVANAELTFTPAGDAQEGGTVADVRTDAAGYYFVALSVSGEYVIGARSEREVLGISRTAVVNRGDNAIDLTLSGGEITTGLAGWDGQTAILVRVAGGGLDVVAAWPPQGQPAPRVFAALPYGDYTVSITSAVAPTSPVVKTVSLSAAGPNANVTFDLGGK